MVASKHVAQSASFAWHSLFGPPITSKIKTAADPTSAPKNVHMAGLKMGKTTQMIYRPSKFYIDKLAAKQNGHCTDIEIRKSIFYLLFQVLHTHRLIIPAIDKISDRIELGPVFLSIMKVKKALFQHAEPLRFTQGRWVRGKHA